jgi:hypothetical protein
MRMGGTPTRKRPARGGGGGGGGNSAGRATRGKNSKNDDAGGGGGTKPKDDGNSATVAAGRGVSSNVIETLLSPKLLDMAMRSIEAHANDALLLEQASPLGGEGPPSSSSRNDEEREGMESEEASMVSDFDGNVAIDDVVPVVPAASRRPPATTIPTTNRLFSTQRDYDELSSLLHETSSHFSYPSAAWRVHANAAKFERLLDERYGRLRPFVERYPGIEIFVRNVQRKYAMGDMSPFRRGNDMPVSRSTAIIGLFMMQRQGVRVDALILIALFSLVGLQPWALVTLVALGRWEVERRRGRRVRGMPKRGRMRICESYHVRGGGGRATTMATDAEESEEEERSRKYEILARPVGAKFNPADLSLRDERHDVVLIGHGVETLYAGALLARAGRRVCVLSPCPDASGCETLASGIENAKFANVPFDVRGTDLAYLNQQQGLLAPALCTSTDVQGGIRFARVGSDKDGYAHTVLSVPGLGNADSCGSNGAPVPVVINAGGCDAIAEYCSTRLGDGYPTTDLDGNVDVGGSTCLNYVRSCRQINDVAGDHYLSRLFSGGASGDSSSKLDTNNAYQQASIRTASAFLNKFMSLNPHVRSLMAAIGMPNENLSPDDTSMAAHITHLCAMLSEEGMAYPVGGPRALCHALASIIEQCDGRVVGGVSVQELLFDKLSSKEKKDTGTENSSSDKGDAGGNGASSEVASGPKPRCRGVRLENGCEVKVSDDDGAVLSTMGFIPTFLHLLPPDVRAVHGVPPGLPAVSERRPLMKILVGLNGTREELDLTGADWYRLPNASLPRDELDPLTGQVQFGTIGSDLSGGTLGMVDEGESEKTDILTLESRVGGRGKRGKVDAASSSTSSSAPSDATKKNPRSKFMSGSSWMKVSFPSAKDPSWFDRYGPLSTCVVTIEADDEFVRMFDTKPRIYSYIKHSGDTALGQRVIKDLCVTFPQLEGEGWVTSGIIDFSPYSFVIFY